MKVGLYIKVDKRQRSDALTAEAFESRVISDSGTFEESSCLLSDIDDLGGTTSIQPFFEKLELFKDEKISVTSLVKDLGDINKIYTDYSKSFTIPASKKNNDILSHWYENSVQDGFDQRVKAEGYIEINTIPFREGLWQLEASEIKENKIQSYSLTFFGNLKTFVDIIAEDKIEDLDFGFIDTPFNDATVVDRVKGDSPDAAVQFPLISNKDFWVRKQAALGVVPFNIAYAGVINYDNLPPAVSVEKIFEAIQTDYGVTFSGGFLNTLFFKRLYLYFKNGEEYLPTLKSQRLNFTTFSQTGITPIIYTDPQNFFEYDSEGLDAYNNKVTLNITPNVSNVPYTVRRFRNGVLVNEYYWAIGGTSNFLFINESTPFDPDGGQNFQGIWHFEITTTQAMSFLGTIVYTGQTLAGASLGATITIPTQALANTIDLNKTAPDMRIVDLISGLVKAFNLVITPKGDNEYSFETLESYYQLGRLRDLTQYAETSNKIERIKVFNRVDFRYQQSGTIINTAFRDLLSRNYADLESDFNGDGGQFTVQLPFETLLFNNLTIDFGLGDVFTNIEMGYNITPDVKPYKNKPILLYKDKVKNIISGASINVANTNITQYLAFGNQTDVGVNTFSLNFGIENSIDTNQPLFNSLYQTYYSAYLNNIYDKKARKIKIKMRLPLSIITSLQLNDRIIIRDKSYLINSFTNELTTGETSIELVQNFRPVAVFLPRSERFDSMAKTEVFDVPQLDDDTIFATITLDPFSTIVFEANKKELTISVTENLTKDTRIDKYTVTSGDIQQEFFIIQNGAE